MNAEPTFPPQADAQLLGELRESDLSHARKTNPSFFERLKKRRWFLLAVALPTLLATIYYGFIASDGYVSESRFVVKSPDQKRSQMSSLANLIQTTGLSGGQEQTNEILGFVQSRDALKGLEREASIRERFASREIDFLSRFPQPFQRNTFEDLYKYYSRMVEARLDSETGLAVIKVKAYTARDAFVINQKLLEQSEALVNRLNARAQDRGIAEAQKQVELATSRARTARMALAEFRNRQEVIDPAKQATGVLEISNGLVAQRAALLAQLDQMQRQTPANPSIPALQSQVRAISSQISAQDGRVVGTSTGMASKLGGYENLLVEQEFATESLNAANAGLVQARAEAQRQQFYLERVVDPNLPDTPVLPKRLLSILTVFAVAICLYFIVWMFVVGILEHASDD